MTKTIVILELFDCLGISSGTMRSETFMISRLSPILEEIGTKIRDVRFFINEKFEVTIYFKSIDGFISVETFPSNNYTVIVIDTTHEFEEFVGLIIKVFNPTKYKQLNYELKEESKHFSIIPVLYELDNEKYKKKEELKKKTKKKTRKKTSKKSTKKKKKSTKKKSTKG